MRLAIALVFASAVAAGAQTRQEPHDAGPAMTPAEVQKIFDGYLIVQAQEALGLTDQQFAQFVPRLKTLQDTRRRNQQERNRLMSELQRLSSPRSASVDEALVRQRLGALQELEARSAAELRKAYSALDEVLNVRQQARFRVFEDQIERKKLELVMRARQNRLNLKRPPL